MLVKLHLRFSAFASRRTKQEPIFFHLHLSGEKPPRICQITGTLSSAATGLMPVTPQMQLFMGIASSKDFIVSFSSGDSGLSVAEALPEPGILWSGLNPSKQNNLCRSFLRCEQQNLVVWGWKIQCEVWHSLNTTDPHLVWVWSMLCSQVSDFIFMYNFSFETGLQTMARGTSLTM